MVLPVAAVAPVQLMGSPAGLNYTLRLTVSKGGRTAYADVWLLVRSGARLPHISLQSLPSAKARPA